MPEKESTLLRWAFEHSSDGMLITNPIGVIRMVNDAFIEMFGYERDEVVGQRTTFLRSRYSTKQFYDQMWRSLREEKRWKGEIINRTKSGEEKTCFLSITPIFSTSGELLGYHGVEIDLTQRKRLEQQIIHSEKLTAIGESVATLVHEIRNPLNGISMNIYMLDKASKENEYWSEGEREAIELIAREAKRLEDLVKNVLDYSRTVELRYERVLLVDFFKEFSPLVLGLAKDAGVSLRLELERTDLTARFDPAQLKQVMLNLIRNAVEAAAQSEQRAVQVKAMMQDGSLWESINSGGTVLLFEVANSGAELDENMKSQLFKPFFTTKPQGLGLGLAITMKIVRQHHGLLEVSKGSGDPFSTIFRVALPC